MAKSNNRCHRRRAKRKRDAREKLRSQDLLLQEYQQEETESQPETPAKPQKSASSSMHKEQEPDASEAAENWAPEDKRKWYILDTNLILSCVDVLYDATDVNWRPPMDFRPCLNTAHLIIPQKVFDELDHIKGGHTINKHIAQKAFKRLEQLIPNSGQTMKDAMMLTQPVQTGWKGQTISILPLHRRFTESLPWVPEQDDNDGMIAVTALAATLIRDGQPVDGTMTTNDLLEWTNRRNDVILLTNDKALRSKANNYCVRSKSYSFKEHAPYNGLREIIVPVEMFTRFFHRGELTLEEFEQFMPSEPPLVANEYLVMTPKDSVYPQSYQIADGTFSNVARYSKASRKLEKLKHMKYEGQTPPNAGIATYYDAMNDDDIRVIIATGMGGTGKTYQIVVHAIRAIRKGQFTKIVMVVDTDNGVGTLPGGLERKVEPMVKFCKDIIREYLAQTPEFLAKRENLRKYGDTELAKFERTLYRERKNNDDLIDEEYIDFFPANKRSTTKRKSHNRQKKTLCNDMSIGDSKLPYEELLNAMTDLYFERYFEIINYNQARGRTFADAILVVDEAQRIVILEFMNTFITRPGNNSLLVVCGDVTQIPQGSPEKRKKNGLIYARETYYDQDCCANIYLTENMRNKMADIANKNHDRVMEELGDLRT